MGDLVSIFLLSLLAMFNPTLLAAVTVMMLLPNTKKLMLGYLLGAYTSSITLGLLIVFELNGTGSVETAHDTIGPGQDIVFGAILLTVAYALAGSKTEGMRERRRRRKEEKQKEKGEKESWPEKMLGRGSARITFAVGVVLTFPGVSYLAALDRIAGLDASDIEMTLLVIGFCLIQQLLLEIPLLGYAIAPERTQRAVGSFRELLVSRGQHIAAIVAAAIGGLLIVRGVISLIA